MKRRAAFAGLMPLLLLWPLPAQAGDAILLCVREGGVVSFVETEPACLTSGGTLLQVAEWEPSEPEDPEPPDETEEKLAAIERKLAGLEQRLADKEPTRETQKPPAEPADDGSPGSLGDLKTRLTGLEDHVAETDAKVDGRLAAIEARLSKLESRKPDDQETGTRVTAPFEVVTETGEVILQVTDSESFGPAAVTLFKGFEGGVVSVQNAGGKEVAVLGAAPSQNGQVYVSTESGQIAAAMNAKYRQIAVLGDDHTQPVVALSRVENGGVVSVFEKGSTIATASLSIDQGSGLLRLLGGEAAPQTIELRFSDVGRGLHVSSGDTPMAFMGIGGSGAGAAWVAGSDGTMAAFMSGNLRQVAVVDETTSVVAALTHEASGGVAAIYKDGVALGALSYSQNGGGGNLTLNRAGSQDGIVSLGAASDGGGEVCVNRITGGGQQRLDCLGVGLPGMGQGK